MNKSIKCPHCGIEYEGIEMELVEYFRILKANIIKTGIITPNLHELTIKLMGIEEKNCVSYFREMYFNAYLASILEKAKKNMRHDVNITLRQDVNITHYEILNYLFSTDYWDQFIEGRKRELSIFYEDTLLTRLARWCVRLINKCENKINKK